MIRRPPRSTQSRSSAASDVYKRQVALTPASAEALGVELTDEDRARPFVEMSGRRGLGVKAEDLLDRLVEKAKEQILARAGEPPEVGRAEAIAVGALPIHLT